jgi:hypothetical protein
MKILLPSLSFLLASVAVGCVADPSDEGPTAVTARRVERECPDFSGVYSDDSRARRTQHYDFVVTYEVTQTGCSALSVRKIEDYVELSTGRQILDEWTLEIPISADYLDPSTRSLQDSRGRQFGAVTTTKRGSFDGATVVLETKSVATQLRDPAPFDRKEYNLSHYTGLPGDLYHYYPEGTSTETLYAQTFTLAPDGSTLSIAARQITQGRPQQATRLVLGSRGIGYRWLRLDYEPSHFQKYAVTLRKIK